MPRIARELGPLELQRLKVDGMHAVGQVPGLHLSIRGAARSWILRIRAGQRRIEIGLGGYPAVTLAQAREKARETRDKVRAGIDPAAERQAARRALVTARARLIAFDRAAEKYIAAHEAGWRNAKHAGQWRSTIETYASPVLGGISVDSIETSDVLRVLEPIWRTKNETASRLRGRIESVLDWATVQGYREGPNPARWRGHLDHLLAKPSKVAKVAHHPALAIDGVPSFWLKLANAEGQGARALAFAVLTAARSGEVRGATWGEIDLKAGLWTIAGERMKAEKEHRVPLSDAAIALLRALPQGGSDALLFPSAKGVQLSDMSLSAVIRRLHDADLRDGGQGFLDPRVGRVATPHGIARSSFRDWAAERTAHPADVVEMALAHAIANKVEAAYRRGDLFEKRRSLMANWAEFCTSALAESSAMASGVTS